MPAEVRAGSRLANPKVNIRIVLAALWICHFILWIFGDMFTILQDMSEPVTGTAIQFVAATTAIVLVLLVAFTLVGRPGPVRLANLIAGAVYLLFDIGFLVEATHGWEFYLGAFYALFSALIMWSAIKWPKSAEA